MQDHLKDGEKSPTKYPENVEERRDSLEQEKTSVIVNVVDSQPRQRAPHELTKFAIYRRGAPMPDQTKYEEPALNFIQFSLFHYCCVALTTPARCVKMNKCNIFCLTLKPLSVNILISRF